MIDTNKTVAPAGGTRIRAALAASCFLASQPAGAAEADAQLLQLAYDAEAEVVETLSDLVNIESGSADRAGLEAVAAYLESRLERLGAQVARLPSATGGPDIVHGRLEGRGNLRVMLLAHTDTVYDKGILEREPFYREDNRVYGPGIADDKGGIAVILHALELLEAMGWSDYARVTVLFNPDEEIGSPGSGETIARYGAQHDVVLSFEPTPAKAVIEHEGVLLGAAGTAQVRMRVDGRAAHAGAAPGDGRNALVELAHQLLQTRDVADEVEGAQLNWTMASAGTARNQIPAFAEAVADARVTRAGANEELLAALQAHVSESSVVPDTTTTVTLEVMRPMYVAGEKGKALAELARRIYSEMDGRRLLMHPTTNGGTDAGFAGQSGHPAVLEGLGLAGWGYHAANEYIEVDSIAPRLYLAARMLIELGERSR